MPLNAFTLFEGLGFELTARRTELAGKAGLRLRQAGYVTGLTFVDTQVS